MEGIKTNIDKLFDQFASDSLAYNVPKRASLNFSGTDSSAAVNNSPPNKLMAKKRKISDAITNASPNQSSRNVSVASLHDSNVSLDAGNGSQSSLLNASTASLVSVQFELRRLRADVLDFGTRNTQLKNELDNRTAIYNRTEYMLKTKVSSLERQLDSSDAKLRDSDKHLKLLRRRDAASQAEVVKAKRQLAEQKCSYEEALQQVQRAKQSVEETLRDTQNDLQQQIAQLTQQIVELENSYSFRNSEFESLTERCAQLQEKCRRQTELETSGDMQKMQLEAAQRRVAELENELAEFGEWKDMAKTFQARVARVPELEQEVERLRRENSKIYDTIGNKLLLEEEVHDLRSRLSSNERSHDDVVALRTTIQLLEAELADYKAVARDHCAPDATTVSATLLRARLEEILQNDLQLTSEKSAVRTEKEKAGQQVVALQKELEIYTKATENLQTSLRYHKTSMHRVQKKLSLIVKERDSYKQLIDNYEKDLTISGGAVDMHPESQIRIKLEMVEKSLESYKEICAGLENELHEVKNLPDLGVDTVNSEHYERFKRDIAVLRQENETLQRRKSELELMLEHCSLKGAYNTDKYKVVHMSLNPTAEAHGAHTLELEKLQAEIERLRRRNRKLEQDHEELTVRMNETTNMTCDLKELGTLREQIKSLDAKNKHQKDVYKQASQEFREVCYILFGYRVDRLGANNYRISSIYAEGEDEYLNFRYEAGGIDMLVTDYSRTLADMVNVYLNERRSLPAFLCTLNLELFNRTTMA